MAEKKITLTKSDRFKVMWRSQFLQGSWNYERMQNGGWAYSMIPALKKLYPNKEDMSAALERHLAFFNTHPYLASPILGVTLALEEDKANGADVKNEAIQGVKVGMMGPLAGVGDPVFWFTVRPIIGALGASMAISGNVLGAILFFVLWNLIRIGFLWSTQEFGYKAGSAITKDMSGGLLQKVTRGASMMGMFVIGALIQRWVTINFVPVVSSTPVQKGGYIEWDKVKMSGEGLHQVFNQVNSGMSLEKIKTTTLQNNLDSLIPGLAALLLTFLCMWLLKKKVSPIWIILGIFAIGVLFHVWGIL
ncbi:MAG: PTS system mannose/fructose/sorbose family transporter subunit IID [Lactobacillus sp.]|nr:PTS system mannose/fructose/sorbose family transporter subunit IID [Lactobacillus sp.]